MQACVARGAPRSLCSRVRVATRPRASQLAPVNPCGRAKSPTGAARHRVHRRRRAAPRGRPRRRSTRFPATPSSSASRSSAGAARVDRDRQDRAARRSTNLPRRRDPDLHGAARRRSARPPRPTAAAHRAARRARRATACCRSAAPRCDGDAARRPPSTTTPRPRRSRPSSVPERARRSGQRARRRGAHRAARRPRRGHRHRAPGARACFDPATRRDSSPVLFDRPRVPRARSRSPTAHLLVMGGCADVANGACTGRRCVTRATSTTLDELDAARRAAATLPHGAETRIGAHDLRSRHPDATARTRYVLAAGTGDPGGGRSLRARRLRDRAARRAARAPGRRARRRRAAQRRRPTGSAAILAPGVPAPRRPIAHPRCPARSLVALEDGCVVALGDQRSCATCRRRIAGSRAAATPPASLASSRAVRLADGTRARARRRRKAMLDLPAVARRAASGRSSPLPTRSQQGVLTAPDPPRWSARTAAVCSPRRPRACARRRAAHRDRLRHGERARSRGRRRADRASRPGPGQASSAGSSPAKPRASSSAPTARSCCTAPRSAPTSWHLAVDARDQRPHRDARRRPARRLGNAASSPRPRVGRGASPPPATGRGSMSGRSPSQRTR